MVDTDFGTNAKLDYAPRRLVVRPEQEGQISTILKKLSKEGPASLVLLADRNGNIIHSSESGRQREHAELGALLAGDLAASVEIARLTENFEEQQVILREGENCHSYISEAGPHLVLFVQTASEVPLGWSRLLVQEAVGELADIFPRVDEAVEEDEAQENSPEMQANIQKAIDDLWQ